MIKIACIKKTILVVWLVVFPVECLQTGSCAQSKYEVDISVTQDAMYGGVATWDREKNKFNIHKSGQIFHCNRLSL